MQHSMKISRTVIAGLEFFTLKAPSLLSEEMHTKNGNSAGKTFAIKSSNPLAAPSIDDELNITNAVQSRRIMAIKNDFIAKAMPKV